MNNKPQTIEEKAISFFKTLGYSLLEVKSNVFQVREITWIFQTDSKNHIQDCSTILFDDAVKILQSLQTEKEEIQENSIELLQSLHIDYAMKDDIKACAVIDECIERLQAQKHGIDLTTKQE